MVQVCVKCAHQQQKLTSLGANFVQGALVESVVGVHEQQQQSLHAFHSYLFGECIVLFLDPTIIFSFFSKMSVVLLLLVFTCSVSAQGDNLDALIDQVFNVKNETSDRNPVNLQPTPSGGGGTNSCTCVAYYLCNNGTINKDGTGIIDIR